MASCTSSTSPHIALRGCFTPQSVCIRYIETINYIEQHNTICIDWILFLFVCHCSVKDLQMLGPAETKLLYTLHWILLFASAECADEEVDANTKNEARTHLFSIPTISLFVYLFAPIVHHLKESDFQNYRLENGVKLWHGMWEFSAPYGSPCFTAAVKPKARQLLNSLLSPRESLDQYCTNRKFTTIPTPHI